ncbi:non-ribosomal peptide synthetase [Desmospora sp. 8437]|nr:non-ribosomal peptide synthetase [Desmospora sp. 8437]
MLNARMIRSGGDQMNKSGSMNVQQDVFVLPASYAQEQLWFFEQMQPESPVYNLVFGYRLTGPLDLGVLKRCLDELIRRHETLRTTFSKQNGKPVQVVHPPFSLSIPVVDLASSPLEDRLDLGLQEAKNEGARPFNLTEGPLFRVKLIRLENLDHLLIFNVHHIVFDGWSANVFLKELTQLYRSFSLGEPSPLPELTLQYADFAYWQKEKMGEKEIEDRISYWEKKLKPEPPRLELPTDDPYSTTQTFSGAIETFSLPQSITKRLKVLGEEEGSSLFMVLLAAFKSFLHRYTGQTDLTSGVAVTSRNRSELEGMIGYFVNQLVVRTDVSGMPSFRELIQRVRKEFLESVHHDIPFGKLVEHLKPERIANHNPFFQVMFLFEDESDGQKELAPGIEMKPLEIDNGTAKFELALRFKNDRDSLIGELEYNSDLFRRDSIQNMIEHLITLLKHATEHPDQSVASLPILTEKERHLFSQERSKESFQYPDLRLVHQLIQEQAERIPDVVAVVGEQGRLTYGELNRRANRLAHYLRKKGVGPGVLVGVHLERSWELMISLLAIWKAGGVYLPLDPFYPKERIAMIVKDAKASLLLTSRKLSESLSSGIKVPLLLMDEEWKAIEEESSANGTLAGAWSPDHLAYVIFTSGSTGRPKGVSVTHRALMHQMEWTRRKYPLEMEDAVLFKTSICFDPSLMEMCNPLLCGARVVLGPPGTEMRPEKQVEIIQNEGVTRLLLVPSILERLLDLPSFSECTSLKEVWTGGEILTPDLERRFFSKMKANLVNMYGPTECCIGVTAWDCTPEKTEGRIPIGSGAPFAQLYVLDHHMQPVPAGVVGELYLGGPMLAEGYINRPDLTEEVFISHPFSGEPGARLYKTGDRVRYREDGTLECLGRVDHQVKVRGVRIELQEIEALLRKHQGVKKAAVLAREDESGETGLVAYLIPEEEPVATAKLRLYLQDFLPAYMIPTHFIFMDAFPVHENNGKLDYKAFPSPIPSRDKEVYLAARDRMELEMVKLWEKVLHINDIGLTDNFFDIGGHSLKAVELLDAIHETFDVELPLTTLFQKSTVMELCDHIRDEVPIWGEILVCMQKGDGSEAPFVMIHPGGGGVLCYYHLTKALGAHQTVYGIQAVGYESGESPLTDIHEMADLYVERLCAQLPRGPYRFLGWSFGATLAYEMTRRMEKRGKKVEFLGLLDAHPFDCRDESSLTISRNSDSLVAWAERMGMDKKELEGLDREQQLLRILRLGQERQILPVSADVSTVKKYLEIMMANRSAARSYTVTKPIQTDLHLFQVQELSPLDPVSLVDPSRWYRRTAGHVREYSIKGHHHNLIDPPHVEFLAKQIRRALIKTEVV